MRKEVMTLMAKASVKVVARENEPFEILFRRFKKSYQESGILQDVRRKEFYMSPSEKRREKSKQAQRRREREERKLGKYEKDVD